MKIKFTKYHGLGNDFIIINYDNKLDFGDLAKKICNRNTGIGSDGLIIYQDNPLTMIFYNMDGSEGTMCGNGLRCFSKYLTDFGLINEKEFAVNTKGGSFKVELVEELVKVEFPTSLDPKLMDINTDSDIFLHKKIMDSTCYAIYSGTSHLVVFVDDFSQIAEEYAKKLHEYHFFRSKINVNFVKVKSRSNLEIKTYERGVGFTLACGTGAVASFKISRMLDLVDPKIEINYQVGDLFLEEIDDKIFMLGPAVRVAEGTYYT